MKRHVITGMCLLAALACYAASIGAGVMVFLAVGFVFELVFWVRLSRIGETAPR